MSESSPAGTAGFRRLGRTDIELPPVCFGAYAIGGTKWGGVDEADAKGALLASFENGAAAVDTAPVYGFGLSERIVGSALEEFGSSHVTVMSKVGLRWDDPRGAFGFHGEGLDGRKVTVKRNSRPDSIRTEVEASLGRLGVERIDLVQVHALDPTTPIADAMGALSELRAEGKIGAIGVSNYAANEIEEAQATLGAVPLASTQTLFHLLDRGADFEVLPLVRSKEIGFLCYSPLAQGLLTGKVTPERQFAKGDSRAGRPPFLPENRRRVIECLEQHVRPIAIRHGASLAQVVIAWTAAHDGVTSALVGARTPMQAKENADAARLGLTAEEHLAIDLGFANLTLLPGSPPNFFERIRGRWHRLRYGDR